MSYIVETMSLCALPSIGSMYDDGAGNAMH